MIDFIQCHCLTCRILFLNVLLDAISHRAYANKSIGSCFLCYCTLLSCTHAQLCVKWNQWITESSSDFWWWSASCWSSFSNTACSSVYKSCGKYLKLLIFKDPRQFWSLMMGSWHPVTNLKEYVSQNPPVVTFFLCLLTLAMSFISLSSYSSTHIVPNPDTTKVTIAIIQLTEG